MVLCGAGGLPLSRLPLSHKASEDKLLARHSLGDGGCKFALIALTAFTGTMDSGSRRCRVRNDESGKLSQPGMTRMVFYLDT